MFDVAFLMATAQSISKHQVNWIDFLKAIPLLLMAPIGTAGIVILWFMVLADRLRVQRLSIKMRWMMVLLLILSAAEVILAMSYILASVAAQNRSALGASVAVAGLAVLASVRQSWRLVRPQKIPQ
jgi:hypothetical protein